MVFSHPIASNSVRAGRRTGRAALSALRAAALLSALATSSWAAGPPVEKGKDAVIPVPDRGVLYVRYGTPGGVRIVSVRRPASVRTPAPAEAAISPDRAEYLARILREELGLMLHPIPDVAVRDARRLSGTAEWRAAGPGETVIVNRGTSAAAIQAPAGTAPEGRGATDAGASPIPAATVPAAGESTAAATPVPVSPDLGDLSAEEAAVELQTAGVLRTTRIRFAYDRADILPESEPALQTLAEVLRRNPDWRVRVEGHADKRGDECYNLGLSRRRAEAVGRFLAARQGIAEDRLKAIGFGETLPLVDEETEEAYAANRRVEFRLMD